jgi:putative ABC transport system substrate-binding protein
VVGFVNGASGDASAANVMAFREGLAESGYVEGQNLTVEYHWLNGDYASLPALMGDLIRRRVAVIATPASSVATLAAKAATATIPIVFGFGGDPVREGLVASYPRPGGNATGIDILGGEIAAKRLALLHELVPRAVRVGLLLNPSNPPIAETTLRNVQEAASALGLQISTQPSLPSKRSGSTRSSSPPTPSLPAAACSLRRSRRGPAFRRAMPTARMSKPAD